MSPKFVKSYHNLYELILSPHDLSTYELVPCVDEVDLYEEVLVDDVKDNLFAANYELLKRESETEMFSKETSSTAKYSACDVLVLLYALLVSVCMWQFGYNLVVENSVEHVRIS